MSLRIQALHRDRICLGGVFVALLALSYLIGAVQLLAVIRWYTALQLCSIAVLPLVALLLRAAPDFGWGLAKLLGVMLVAWLAWLLSLLGLAFSFKIVLAGLLILALPWFLTWQQIFGYFKSAKTEFKNEVICIEYLFALLFLGLIIIRVFLPEISWGEKPMDFSFLNYFVRTDTMPPQDPWAAGHTMQYYYFGFILLSTLHHLSQVEPTLGFNLALCTIIPIAACVIYSGLRALGISRRQAVLLPLAVYLFSNLETLRIWIFDGKAVNFDSFWASSRAFQSPGINEYPFWAFLFGDLHAHFIATPFLACVIISGCLVHFSVNKSEISAFSIPCALSLGALLSTNSWDFITTSAWIAACLFPASIPLLALTLLGANWLPEELRSAKLIVAAYLALCFLSLIVLRVPFRQVRSIILNALIIGLVALIVALPWLLTSTPTRSPGWGYNNGTEMNSISQIARVHGLWLIALLSLDLVLALRLMKVVRISNLGINLAYALTPIALAAITWCAGNTDWSPWIVVLSSLVAFIGISAYQNSAPLEILRPLGLAIASAAILICASELFYFIDRMNTLFKVHNTIWILLGLGSLSVGTLFPTLSKSERWALLPILMTCLIGVAASALNIKATLFENSPRSEGPRPSLDGTIYLKQTHPDDFQMYQWINKNIVGTPALLEATGAPYQADPFSRVAMNTGLPILLGWEYHVSQRGLDSKDLDQRRRAVREIYTTTDAVAAFNLLQQYNIELVYVGDRERQAFPGRGLLKFEVAKSEFVLLARRGQNALFAVATSPLTALSEQELEAKHE